MTRPEGAPGDGPSSPTEVVDWNGTARFEVLSCIGRGGMGAVYLARDRERRQSVALKTVLHFDAASLYQFKQEFRTLAGVIHPNLVRLHELVGTESDRVFFSMEFVRGTDFLRHVQRTGTAPRLDDSGVQLHAPSPMPFSVPAVSRDRRNTPADVDRLLPALRQLVAGVQALHSAGKLHRDIKPPNVLVSTEGRVVLLDFGVATDLRRVAVEAANPEEIVGTATYMAPEQAFEDAPTAAADWYSVGVMLYEALVGVPPFVGSALDVIHRKNNCDPPTPAEVVDGVPAELDALCRALLDRAPDRRPKGPEILERLGANGAAERIRSDEPRAVSLVGREAQVAQLEAALARVRRGRTVTMRVGGRAGMGKSALAQAFLDHAEQDGAVVLRGRAYERESLPYKAVDGIIDALSRYLIHLADHGDTFAFPADIGALVRLFPVLRRVPVLDRLPEEPLPDPARTRRRAFGALREVLGKLARRRSLILYIDDAQWGDTDSAALLLDLVRPPHAPPVLIMLAHREEDTSTAPFLTELRARWPAGADARDVTVGPLDAEGTRRLALALLGAEGRAEEDVVDAVARESGGNPFLLEELAREAPARFLAAHGARVTLEQVVDARLAELPEDARRLLEVVAVAGRPLPLSLLGEASERDAVEDLVSLLAAKRFVRPRLRDGREVAEPIHDRVRETIVALLPDEVVRACHGQLARVLEATPGAEPESVAIHLLGAGEIERGGRFAIKAAERASTLLAFDQAARLYQLAIDTTGRSNGGPLHARLAEVLGWAGRHEQAGRAYTAAAEAVEPSARAPLERAAAAQLLAGGSHRRGRDDASPRPRGRGGRRPRLAGGGRGLAGRGQDRPADPRPPLRGAQSRRCALRRSRTHRRDARGSARSRLRRRRSLCEPAGAPARRGDSCRRPRPDRARRGALLRKSPRHARRTRIRSRARRACAHRAPRREGGSAEEIAFSRGTYGVGLYIRGRWSEAMEVIDAAYANLPSQQAGMQSQAAVYAAYCLVSLGQLVELRRRTAQLRADAEQRGDLFTQVMLSASHPLILKLADDDPESARAAIREAKAQWTHGKFLLQDWQIMRSEAEIELYVGDGAAAYDRLERDRGPLDKSMLLNVQLVRIFTVYAVGRAAIASLDAAGPLRSERIAEANQRAIALRAEQMPWADVYAAILTACVKNAEGDREATLLALREAIALAEATEMMLHGAAARHQLGLLLGGPEGIREHQQAEEIDARAGRPCPRQVRVPLRPRSLELRLRFRAARSPALLVLLGAAGERGALTSLRLGARPFARKPLAQKLRHDMQQPVRFDWLRDVGIETRRKCVLAIFRPCERGQRHDREVAARKAS